MFFTDFRHECKIEISRRDLPLLRTRLSGIAKRDPHAQSGQYSVRSLYFDTPEDDALFQKINGTNRREKFRLRYYNGDTSFLRLERKNKIDGLCSKQSAELTVGEAQRLLDGDTDWMLSHPHGLIRELYAKYQTRLLRPRTIVEYTREPFVYPFGNVRVTFDYDIRTSLGVADFLSPDCPTVPVGNTVLMEVKWDRFLPDVIRLAVGIPGSQPGAFSKYAQCRIFD